MLHLKSAALYALGPLACAWVYAREGALPFQVDSHPIQMLTGVCFAACGVPLLLLADVPAAVRYVLSLGAAWLACDEWLTIHECVKFGLMPAGTPLWLGDALIFVYALGAALTYIVPAARDDGLCRAEAGALFVILNLAAAASRLVWG